MLPAVRPGDVLFVERREIRDARIGDVILFTVADRLFAHRVVRTGPAGVRGLTLVTKGDTHRAEDLPIDADQLLGHVVRLRRNGRDLAAPFRYSWSRSLAWFAAARCLELLSGNDGGLPEISVSADPAPLPR